jgi:hypothetical protein
MNADLSRDGNDESLILAINSLLSKLGLSLSQPSFDDSAFLKNHAPEFSLCHTYPPSATSSSATSSSTKTSGLRNNEQDPHADKSASHRLLSLCESYISTSSSALDSKQLALEIIAILKLPSSQLEPKLFELVGESGFDLMLDVIQNAEVNYMIYCIILYLPLILNDVINCNTIDI